MRLWDYRLINYLPRQQLLSQWRELNSIYSKQDKHILINYIYEYPKQELLMYSLIVLNEIKKRGYKINSVKKFNDYFKGVKETYYQDKLFSNHHTDEYMKICCWNLYEKYIRGQDGFTKESIQFIKERIK